MEYHTPGVYIREVDSGAKPIASVATSIPGFLGIFKYEPSVDAVAITGTDGTKTIRGKVVPQLVDTKGNVTAAKPEDAVSALTTAFQFKRSQIKNLKALLELNGHKASVAAGDKGKTKITVGKTEVQVAEAALSADGKIVTDDEAAIEDLLNTVHAQFPIDKPKPKAAKDLLSVYGYEFSGSEGTALLSEYSAAPFAVTNKAEFFRWLQSYFAQFLVETKTIAELVGRDIADPDEAADAVFEALNSDDNLRTQFRNWLSQPSVFSFVAGVNGFYDNGGGKAYVYLMGVKDLDVSVRENQADKLGLYAFDDCDDMALHVGPGLSFSQ
jgi:hypothetical protein